MSLPPVLDYATPRRPVMELAPFSGRWFCIIATIPTATLSLWYALSGVNLRGLEIIIMPAIFFGMAFVFGAWPAILITHRPGTGTRAPPSSVLNRRTAKYVCIMLAAFISLLPTEVHYNSRQQYLIFTLLHWGILLWLATDFWRHALMRLPFVIILIVATLGMSVKVQRCPHSTTWAAFGQQLIVVGKQCGNPKVFRPWWWPRP